MTAEIFGSYMIGFTEAFLQLWFSDKILGSKATAVRYAFFAVSTAAVFLVTEGTVAAAAAIVLPILAAEARAARSEPWTFAVCASSAAVIMRLCYGICGCAECLILPHLLGSDMIFTAFAVSGNIFPIVMAYLCYKNIIKKSPVYALGKEDSISAILPLILILGLDIFIEKAAYGNTVSTESLLPADIHAKLLAVRILFLISVLCTLHAYNRIAASRLAEQTYLLDKRHTEQAKKLYADTVSFRHDVKNHLLVLRGLIRKKEYEKAAAYADELYGQNEKLSFGFSSGRPVLDILLGEKLSALENIRTDCSVKIPDELEISDAELCVIMANAVDNAVAACAKTRSENKYIVITCRRAEYMFLIEIKNSFDGKKYSESVGLANIRAAVKKCGGKVIIDTDNNVFDLKLLFNISRH